jgi:hypothetical protein
MSTNYEAPHCVAVSILPLLKSQLLTAHHHVHTHLTPDPAVETACLCPLRNSWDQKEKLLRSTQHCEMLSKHFHIRMRFHSLVLLHRRSLHRVRITKVFCG